MYVEQKVPDHEWFCFLSMWVSLSLSMKAYVLILLQELDETRTLTQTQPLILFKQSETNNEAA